MSVPTAEPLLTIEGPGWALKGLTVRAGRFPLSVEAHLLNMTARLVPGATTVTINARYYSLHGLIALEADRRGLSAEEAYALLRRCEVVVAGASVVHPDAVAGTPHGYDVIKPHLDEHDALDVASLATPGGYSDPRTGFLNPYLGSELTLKILAGPRLEPGDRLNSSVLYEGFDGIFSLADQDHLTRGQLAEQAHLAIGASNNDLDGRWLRRLLCSVGTSDAVKTDETRRGTIRLLARAAQRDAPVSIVDSFRDLVAYGSLEEDPVTASVPEAQAWRGTLFRHDSVGAWRVLWAWLVDQISEPSPPSVLYGALADALPTGTLGQFLDGLPSTMAGSDPVDAEGEVRAQRLPIPNECLALLAIGARRSHELEDTTRAALVGDQRRTLVLSPVWLAGWIEERRAHQMSEVAVDLVDALLDRSRRVALGKLRQQTDGTFWLPTRVREYAGLLVAVGQEGRGNVGLRLMQLARMLEVLGVLERSDARWGVTDEGHALLGMGQ